MPFIIDDHSFGSIVINGNEYTSDVIITQNKIISDWWRKDSHKLTPEDLALLNLEEVKSIFIGTGWSGKMQVSKETKNLFESLNIPYIAIRTPVAIKEYNRFSHINKIGIFHLTC